MDSLTQIVLGASVAEALGGKKLGYRAALWGAFAGTLPDLDVLTSLFLDPVDYLAAHRGFSHSVFFPFIAAPILAWIATKIHTKIDMDYRSYLKMFFWAVLTHPILDSFTGYGTQLFNPITNYAVEFNTIFIIDPLYTLPFLFLWMAALLFKPGSLWRRRLNTTGLAISTTYLVITVLLKITAIGIFEKEMNRQGIVAERYMTIPGPFSSVFWRALIETEDEFLQGYVSVFDVNPDITFYSLPKTKHLAAEWDETPAMQRLDWFSKGYYHVTLLGGVPHINDLRFGSMNGWRGSMEDFIFTFRLNVDEDPVGFTQITEPVDITADDLTALFRVMFNR